MGRVPEFDGLRGLAATAVIVHHLFLWRSAFWWGWSAVDLFFVLSGYLITAILVRERGRPGWLRSFYARRSLRIWPIYYLTLLAAYLASKLGAFPPGMRAGRRELAWYAFYAQDLPSFIGLPNVLWRPMGHAWTLGIEEQFYLLWPLLVLLAGRRVGLLAVLTLAGGVAYRAAGGAFWCLPGRLDGLALGALLAVLVRGEPARTWPRVRPWAAVAGVLALSVGSYSAWRAVRAGLRPFGFDRACPWADILSVNLAFFALVAVVACRAGARPLAPLRVRPLVFLGTISYGLYLYHQPIMFLVGQDRPAAVIAVTLAVAVASWYLVERPILALKKRFDYREPARRSGPQLETCSVPVVPEPSL